MHECCSSSVHCRDFWPFRRSNGHDLGMKSRVHSTYKTKYHVGNWSEYERSLRYKSIIGDRFRARRSKAQDAEALIACDILNRITELGRPASFAIGP